MAIPRATGSRAIIPAANQTVATGAPGPHSGAAARERAMKEFETTRQARETRALGLDWAAYNNTRFRLDDPSKTARTNYTPRYAADLIILDNTWDDPYFAYGHTEFETGKGYSYELCPHESFNCPICPTKRGINGEPMKHGTYEMHCTALDITPTQEQEDQARADGVEFRRKRALAISNQLHPTFFALFKECMDANGGRIRGMMLLMERTPDFNSSIGKPVMRPNGVMYDFITEEELQEFAHPELRDSVTNEIVKPANFDITPFDYQSIFPKIDKAYVDRQRALYGSGAPGAGRDGEQSDGWRSRDRSGGAGDQQAATPPATRTRQRSTYAVGTPPAAKPAAVEQEVTEVPDDGGQVMAPAKATDAKTLPIVRQRVRTPVTAPVAPPTGEAVRPGATRTRQRSGVAAKAAAGVDADIPWTGDK